MIMKYDTIIIGAGAAGLACGTICAQAGCAVLIIDREEQAGGILNQCIHNGFGLRYFKEELTGPEFAYKMVQKAQRSGVELALASTVTTPCPAPRNGRTGGTETVMVIRPVKSDSIPRCSIRLPNGCWSW